MRTIFWLFRFLQSGSTLSCLVIHILGLYIKDEPMAHELFFCGIYFCFWFYSIIAIIGFFLGAKFHLLTEIITNLFGCIFFVIAGFVTMGHVESDQHLMYLTDEEELMHPFFHMNRGQSVASICTGIIFLLNALLQLDMLLITEENTVGRDMDPARKPIKGDFHTDFNCLPGLASAIQQKSGRNIDRTV